MDRRARAEPGSHGEAGHPTASSEHAHAIVRLSERQCREPRRFVQVAHEAVEHFELERPEPRRRPNRHAEPRAFQNGGERIERGQGNWGSRDRTAFDARAQRGQIGGERHAKAGCDDFDFAAKARNCCVGLRGQPDNASRDVRPVRPRRRSQQPLVQGGPGLRQGVACQQHDVGAHARFARRRQHDAGFAQTIEIAHQRRRMHMIDDAADPLGERDGRPRALDVGAQSRDERLTASRQELSRGDGRVFE